MFRRLMLMALPVVIIGLGVWGAIGMMSTDDTVDEEAPALASGVPGDIPTVSTLTLVATSAAPEWLLYGQWRPDRRLQTVSPVAAEVLSVEVQAGDRVTAGDRLVQLATRDIERQRSQLLLRQRELAASRRDEAREQEVAEAALVVEQTLVNIAERALERVRDLSQRNLAAASELEEAERVAQQQRLSLRQQEVRVAGHDDRLERIDIQRDDLALELEEIAERIEDATVVAPFDGEVASVSVQVGDQVNTQAPLVSLISQTRGRLEAVLPPHRIEALSQGMQGLLIHEDEPDRHIALTLTNWSPVSEGGSVRLRLEPDRSADAWAFAPVVDRHYQAVLQLPAVANVWVLPLTSLYENQFVYQVQDETLTRRQVEVLGYRQSANTTSAQAGSPSVIVRSAELDDGDSILTTRLANAITGLPVLVREQ